MHKSVGFVVAVCLVVASIRSSASATEESVQPILRIGPTGPIVRNHTGFNWTEGPASDRDGNLNFTDYDHPTIYRVDVAGRLSAFLKHDQRPNGLFFKAPGNLAACERLGRVILISLQDKSIRPLAAEYNGNRLNAPNDLMIDRSGGAYFTDPHFRAPMPQGVPGVYYLARDGKINRLVEDLYSPNGIILSPDEKTLYVVPTLLSGVMAYEVARLGVLGEENVFFRLKRRTTANGKAGIGQYGGNGMTVDVKGNLYITSALGIQVYDPGGNLLCIIPIPEPMSNLTFGGSDRRTLFVTASTSLYAMTMKNAGRLFPAAESDQDN